MLCRFGSRLDAHCARLRIPQLPHTRFPHTRSNIAHTSDPADASSPPRASTGKRDAAPWPKSSGSGPCRYTVASAPCARREPRTVSAAGRQSPRRSKARRHTPSARTRAPWRGTRHPARHRRLFERYRYPSFLGRGTEAASGCTPHSSKAEPSRPSLKPPSSGLKPANPDRGAWAARAQASAPCDRKPRDLACKSEWPRAVRFVLRSGSRTPRVELFAL